MRILFLFLVVFVFRVNAQPVCVDSSIHVSYQPLGNDSFRIEKQLLAKDGAKIYAGWGNTTTTRDGRVFILKVDADGEVLWCKKINLVYTPSGAMSIGALYETPNGNIFFTTAATQEDDRPFFYWVISPAGGLLKAVKLGFSDVFKLGDTYARAPLLSNYGTDSTIVGFYYHDYNGQDVLIVFATDNNGNPSKPYFIKAPLATSQRGSYNYSRFENNRLLLMGAGDFENYCKSGSGEITKYYLLEIDWSAKKLLKKKAYCSPTIGNTFGYFTGPIDAHTFSTRHYVFPQANGNVIFTRSVMGVDINQGGINRLFSVSEFDSNFNHLKTEFITGGDRFKRSAYFDIFIDSFNNRHIRAHDMPNRQLYYAVGTGSNNYFFQKKLPFSATEEGKLFVRQQFLEPGYFTSFNIVSTYGGKTNIDNFRILTADTSAACFGENVNFLSSNPATVTPIDWQGDFSIEPATLDAIPANISLEDYAFKRTVVCNLVNVCDKFELNAPDTVCNLNIPVVITAHKNSLCRGKVNFVFDTAQVASYRQLNDTTLQLWFNKAYKGFVYAQPSSCSLLKDSSYITVFHTPTNVNLGGDKLFCPDSVYRLNAYSPEFKTYLWQNGSSDSLIVVSSPGKYYVTATDFCNRQYSDTLIIKDNVIDFRIEGDDTTICKPDALLLNATDSLLTYQWYPVEDVKIIAPNKVLVSPQSSSTFWVVAEKFNGCFVSDSIRVNTKECPETIFFPNAFTPNNDGVNDWYKPGITGNIEEYELKIYNRWGQLVFETTKPAEFWDGKYKNVIIPGLYAYVCKYKFHRQEGKVHKGQVYLLQ